ncbi:MAG TPA: hypothetical protein VH024_14130, partial [Candidatus Angelobacter sp.]|nr:hypothetical protein [Candidatus Angelobacter sp.]
CRMRRTRSRIVLLFSALLEIYGWQALNLIGPASIAMSGEAASRFQRILSSGNAIGVCPAGGQRKDGKPSLQRPAPWLLRSRKK